MDLCAAQLDEGNWGATCWQEAHLLGLALELACALLALRGWGVADWDAMYEDLPSRQTKVRVADRTAILTTPDETRTTAPAGLQEALDAIIARFDAGRAFVRPSGTEDVVRVYAEARTQALADELAARVARCAWELAGGVGDAPPAAEATHK